MMYKDALKSNLEVSIAAKVAFLADHAQFEIFQSATDSIVRAYKEGGRLYIAGNGGSAADAQHLAAEFVSKLSRDRGPLAAEALTVDTSILTAIGNDYGYDELFARQVRGKMRRNDVFLGITTSGRSRNINRALHECREMGLTTIVFSGRDGGESAKLADYAIVVRSNVTSVIQEIHIVLAHTLCGCVEHALVFAN